MMKKSFFSDLLICFAVFFISCGNPVSYKQLDKENILGELKISLSELNVRTVSPERNCSYKDVDVWNLKLKNGENIVVDESVSMNENFSFNMKIAKGVKYSLELTGTNSSVTPHLIYKGYINDVVIAENENTIYKTIFVQLDKNGNGSFSYTVNLDEALQNQSYKVALLDPETKVTLTEKECKRTGSETGMSSVMGTGSIGSSSTLPSGLSIECSPSTDGKSLNCFATSIPAGLYEIAVFYEKDGVYYPLILNDNLIEVAANLNTEYTSASKLFISRTYFVTTSDSDGNGLTANYRINYDELMIRLRSDKEIGTWKEINVFLSETDDLTAFHINPVSGKNQNVYYKNILIYNDAGFNESTLNGLGFFINASGNIDYLGNSDFIVVNDAEELVSALSEAADGDTICISETINLSDAIIKAPENATVIIKKADSFTGTYMFTGSGTFGQYDDTASVLIFDGNNKETDYSLFYSNGSNGQINFYNCEFKSANCTGNGGVAAAGNNNSLHFTNCNIHDCKAVSGGAVYADNSNVYIQNTVIKDCIASENGNAVYSSASASCGLYILDYTEWQKTNISSQSGESIYIGSENVVLFISKGVDIDTVNFANGGNYTTVNYTVATNNQNGYSGVDSGAKVNVSAGLYGISDLQVTEIITENSLLPVSGNYVVRDAAGLMKVSEWSNKLESPASFENVTFTITNDIKIESGWNPIGANGTGFSGILDGNGHTISVPVVNFTEGDSEQRFAGVVGNNKGTIQNIIYYIEEYSESDAGFVNCTTGDNNVWTGSVGGIASKNFGTIKNCWNRVNMETPYLRLGGIAGWNYGSIVNCVNTGNLRVYNATNNAPRAGGIAGAMETKYEASIKNCVNYGTVGLKSGYTQSDVHSVPGAICGDIYDSTDLTEKKTQTFANCYFAKNCVVIEESKTASIIFNKTSYGVENTEGNENILSVSSITSCGTFDSSYKITAGSAATCFTVQTLEHGTNLLDAVKGYVSSNPGYDYKNWKVNSDGKVILDF